MRAIQEITKLLEAKFLESGFEDCFIVDIVHNENSNKLDIFIDSDSKLDLEKCRVVSRMIEAYLDESLVIGEKYKLEVSSPGLDKPIQLVRQYKKNIGRELKVTLNDDTKHKGKLISVKDDSITIEFETKQKIKKKTIRSIEQKNILLADIKQTFVVVKF